MGASIPKRAAKCGCGCSFAQPCADIIQIGSFPWPNACRNFKDQPVRDALRAVLIGRPSGTYRRLLPFARPHERRFRRPRLDTVATSATADLMIDVVGLRRPLYDLPSRD